VVPIEHRSCDKGKRSYRRGLRTKSSDADLLCFDRFYDQMSIQGMGDIYKGPIIVGRDGMVIEAGTQKTTDKQCLRRQRVLDPLRTRQTDGQLL
jgi:hypothetical protein